MTAEGGFGFVCWVYANRAGGSGDPPLQGYPNGLFFCLLGLRQGTTAGKTSVITVGANHLIRPSSWRKDVYEGSRIAYTVRIEFTCNKAGGPGVPPLQ